MLDAGRYRINNSLFFPAVLLRVPLDMLREDHTNRKPSILHLVKLRSTIKSTMMPDDAAHHLSGYVDFLDTKINLISGGLNWNRESGKTVNVFDGNHRLVLLSELVLAGTFPADGIVYVSYTVSATFRMTLSGSQPYSFAVRSNFTSA